MTTTNRKHLHDMIDRIPESALFKAEELLKPLTTRTFEEFVEALRHVPEEDPTEDELAALAECEDDDEIISHEEIKREFGIK
ncbi:MAG: hypothetical protein O2816_01505 [Planctomycetota bacterium]|nr:hypothetical protein [Planctomycetota bacterium]